MSLLNGATITGTNNPGGTFSINSNTNASSWGTITASTSPASIHVTGNAEIEGDLKIQGISLQQQIKELTEKITSIDERLAILRPNPELEKRWDKLRLLREQYMEMERELTELDLVFDILSGKRDIPK
jgi:hypothetical protein